MRVKLKDISFYSIFDLARDKTDTEWPPLQNKPKEDSKFLNEIQNSPVNSDVCESDSTVIVPASTSEIKLNEILQLSLKCLSSEVGDMKNKYSYILMYNKIWDSFISNVIRDNCERKIL